MCNDHVLDENLPYLFNGKQLEYRFPLVMGIRTITDGALWVPTWRHFFGVFPKKSIRLLYVNDLWIMPHPSALKHLTIAAEHVGVDLTIDTCVDIGTCVRLSRYGDACVYSQYDIILLFGRSTLSLEALRVATTTRTLLVVREYVWYYPDRHPQYDHRSVILGYPGINVPTGFTLGYRSGVCTLECVYSRIRKVGNSVQTVLPIFEPAGDQV